MLAAPCFFGFRHASERSDDGVSHRYRSRRHQNRGGGARWSRRAPSAAAHPDPGDYAGTIAAVAGLVARIERDIGPGASVGIAIPGTIVAATGLVKNAN